MEEQPTFADLLLDKESHWELIVSSATEHLRRIIPDILPVENALLAIITYGEGWHNYHHIFPSDYRASELGVKYNITTTVIDMLARLGLVYDMRTIPEHLVKQRMNKTGDGSKTAWT
ncbi:Desaturase 1 [Carabus blaptoides fortunei]